MKLLKSFKYALSGLAYCVKNERNFRIHITAALTASLLAWFYELQAHQTVLLVFTVIFVFVTEMVNTAIESAVDLSTKNKNDNARIAKDVAAGAVLVSAIFAIIIGIVLFGNSEKLIKLWYFISKSLSGIIAAGAYIATCLLFIGRNKKE